MKKSVFAATLAAIALAATSAFAGPQDFVLANNTCHTVLAVYASPTGTPIWENDMMGNSVLLPGESMTFSFNGYAERFWDVRIVYADSKADAIFYGIDLVSTLSLVIRDNFLGGTHMNLVEI